MLHLYCVRCVLTVASCSITLTAPRMERHKGSAGAFNGLQIAVCGGSCTTDPARISALLGTTPRDEQLHVQQYSISQ